jgi:hypothetical protein
MPRFSTEFEQILAAALEHVPPAEDLRAQLLESPINPEVLEKIARWSRTVVEWLALAENLDNRFAPETAGPVLVAGDAKPVTPEPIVSPHPPAASFTPVQFATLSEPASEPPPKLPRAKPLPGNGVVSRSSAASPLAPGIKTISLITRGGGPPKQSLEKFLREKNVRDYSDAVWAVGEKIGLTPEQIQIFLLSFPGNRYINTQLKPSLLSAVPSLFSRHFTGCQECHQVAQRIKNVVDGFGSRETVTPIEDRRQALSDFAPPPPTALAAGREPR